MVRCRCLGSHAHACEREAAGHVHAKHFPRHHTLAHPSGKSGPSISNLQHCRSHASCSSAPAPDRGRGSLADPRQRCPAAGIDQQDPSAAAEAMQRTASGETLRSPARFLMGFEVSCPTRILHALTGISPQPAVREAAQQACARRGVVASAAADGAAAAPQPAGSLWAQLKVPVYILMWCVGRNWLVYTTYSRQ